MIAFSFVSWCETLYFFTPIPCSYTSSPLDGITFFIYMDTQDHAILSSLDPCFQPLMHLERWKTIWSELELNPGTLASQATALTTRPCLLGRETPCVEIRAESLSRALWCEQRFQGLLQHGGRERASWSRSRGFESYWVPVFTCKDLPDEISSYSSS